jgi:hypothetical protein
MSTRRLLWVLPLLLGGCFQDSTPKHSDYLPLDYQSKFRLVRACRQISGHESNYEQVLASPASAADAYSLGTYPLPEGSVIVAEQHGDPSCGSLNGYYLMAKEKAGYDPAGSNWHWQKLDINQRIEEDGKLGTCSSCHAKCASNDGLCAPP